MSKFKVGPATSKDGREVVILEVMEDGVMFGRFKGAWSWVSEQWGPDGSSLGLTGVKLLPNHEQLRAEFEATVYGNTVDGYIVDVPIGTPFKSGCPVKVTLEVLE